MIRPSIVEFFENSSLLNIKNLSPVQKMVLKAVMGEPLDSTTPIEKSHPYQEHGFANEVEMYKFFTGKDHYECKFFNDVDLIMGRRGGKSTTLGAGLAIYFATQFDYKPFLGTSPHATIPIISASKDQANECYQAVKNMLLKSPYLFKKFLDGKIENIQDEYSDEDLKDSKSLSGGSIKLNNKVVIKVMAADISKTRGFAAPFVILDEICFFGTDGNDLKNSDRGIYEALAPTQAQFQAVEGMAMVLKISSPNGQAGLTYENYEKKTEEDICHFQIPTWYSNISIPIKYLEKQKKKGLAFFNREYGAQYTASETSYLDPNAIDKAIIRGIDQLDAQDEYRYAAVIDYASKKDYWAFGIGHKEYITDLETKEKSERVQVDCLQHWRGTDGAELDPSKIVPEICKVLKSYRVSMCIADQYSFAALKPYFQKEGILLKEFTSSASSKTKFMYSLQVAINSGKLKLVNNPIAIKHLKDLREKRQSTGYLKIEAAAGSHDDYANVIALVQYQFDKTSPIYIGLSKEQTDDVPTTKDVAGNFISTPTAQDLAEFVGVSNFQDSAHEKKLAEEEEVDVDNDGFWFSV